MIWTLITIILFLIGAYYITKNQIEDERRIREGIRAIGRKGRQRKRYIFAEENETEEDTAFAVPIDLLEEEEN